MSLEILRRDAFLALHPTAVETKSLVFTFGGLVSDYFLELSQKLQLLHQLVSAVVGLAEERSYVGVKVFARVLNELQRLLVGALAGVLDFRNGLVKVLAVRVRIEHLGVLFEGVPVL